MDSRKRNLATAIAAVGIAAGLAVSIAWAGRYYDGTLGQFRSDVAGTLQITSGESVTIPSTGILALHAGTFRIEGAGGVADNLDKITGTNDGDILFLRPATSGHTITIRHSVAGGGNLTTPSTVDYAIPNYGYVMLYDAGESLISVTVAIPGGGGIGDVVSNVATAVESQICVSDDTDGKHVRFAPAYIGGSGGLILPDISSPDATSSGYHELYFKGNSRLYTMHSTGSESTVLYEYSAGEDPWFDTLQLGVGSAALGGTAGTIDAYDTETKLARLASSVVTGPSMVLFRATTPLAGAQLGAFQFSGDDAGGGTAERVYAEITADQATVTAGALDGILRLYAYRNGTSCEYLRVDGTAAVDAVVVSRGLACESPLSASFGKDAATNVAGKTRYWSAGAVDFWTDIIAGTNTQNNTFTLPVDDGTASQFLQTDGAGALSWATVAEADTLATVTARGETATANLSVPTGSSFLIGSTSIEQKMMAQNNGALTAADSGRLLQAYSYTGSGFDAATVDAYSANLQTVFCLEETSGTRAATVGTDALVDSGSTGRTTGKRNYAATFAGTTKLTDTSLSVSYSADFTINFWTKCTNANDNNRLVDFAYVGGSGFQITMYNGVVTAENYTDPEALNTVVAINDGNWHMVTFTRTGTLMSAYIDGAVKDTETFTSPSLAYSGLAVAARFASVVQPYIGDIDEFTLWNDDLSATAITDLYYLGAGKFYEAVAIKDYRMSAYKTTDYLTADALAGAVDFGIDGGGSAVAAGWYWQTPTVSNYDGYYVGDWQMTAGDTATPESGTANVQVYRTTFAAWPAGTSTLCMDLTMTASSVATGTMSASGETVIASGDRFLMRVVSATQKGLQVHLPTKRR